MTKFDSMTKSIERRLQDDRGVLAGADILLFGLIGIVFTSIVILNAWVVVDTSLAVSAAAREGARTFVESEPGEAETNSRAAMEEVMSQYGHDAGDTTFSISNTGFTRCAEVTATANQQIDLLFVPIFGDFGSHTITATHTERIDPFRSGSFDFASGTFEGSC